MPIRRILAAVDHSPAGAQALRAGVALGEAPETSLVTATIIAGPAAGVGSVLAETRAREEYAGLVAETPGAERAGHRVSFGVPAVELARWAEQEQADLLVLGREPGGRLERCVAGSTIAGTLRRARIPCLVLPWGAPSRISRVLAAVDAGPAATDVLHAARALATLSGGDLVALHVQRETMVQSAAAAREADRVAASVEAAWGASGDGGRRIPGAAAVSPLVLGHGEIVPGILRAVREERADVIVVGHHRGELITPECGAVASRLLQRAEYAILAVPI
jgi:nucleotide-binding universal stress UspA family protein